MVGLHWVPGHGGVRGNEIVNEFAMGGSILGFLGPEPALGVSRRDIRRRISRWFVNQHWALWPCLGYTQRQAQELIYRHCLGVKAKFLCFDRTHFRAVTGLLIGHNTLRRHLHLLGLLNNSLLTRCAAEEEISFHVLIWVPFPWSQRTSRV